MTLKRPYLGYMDGDLVKPIGRIPPSITGKAREHLVKGRSRQNYTYQAKIYLLELVRKHDEIPAKYFIGGMDATKSYLQILENQAKEEQLKKEAIADDQ